MSRLIIEDLGAIRIVKFDNPPNNYMDDETIVALTDCLNEVESDDVVRVIIGEENTGDLLWPLSIVVSRYGVPGEAMGTVGVVGPTRMEYSRTISGVRLMSSAMSDLVENIYLS